MAGADDVVEGAEKLLNVRDRVGVENAEENVEDGSTDDSENVEEASEDEKLLEVVDETNDDDDDDDDDDDSEEDDELELDVDDDCDDENEVLEKLSDEMLRLEITSDSDETCDRLMELRNEDGMDEVLLSLELSEMVASSQLLDSRGSTEERDDDETTEELLLEDMVEVRRGCIEEVDAVEEGVDVKTEDDEMEPAPVRLLSEKLSTDVLRAVKLDSVDETFGTVDADDTFVSLALLTSC